MVQGLEVCAQGPGSLKRAPAWPAWGIQQGWGQGLNLRSLSNPGPHPIQPRGCRGWCLTALTLANPTPASQPDATAPLPDPTGAPQQLHLPLLPPPRDAVCGFTC